jgi:predicted nucleic-acid-binding Zn-ribbon protein
MSVRCIGCGARSVHRHHVITRQECKRRGIDADTPENLVPLCLRCHFQHHRCLPKLKQSVLPGATVEWADGIGMAWFLDRYYEGA